MKPAEADLRLPRQRQLQGIVDDLASDLPVSDERFDALFPKFFRQHSASHWTPVDVARRAAELLYAGPRTSVLDVGSGVGKFCTVAALTVPATYTGVEERPSLVAIAREIVRRYDVPDVTYLEARLEDIDWSSYTGFYFYNPFAENYYPPSERVDESVPFGHARFRELTQFVRKKLEALPTGKRLVTYHGYGGETLTGWVEKRRERCGDDYLVLSERSW